MSTISVEVRKDYYPQEFMVGEFTMVRPSKEESKDLNSFVKWINYLAKQGLVFHSEILGSYLFRAELPK